MASFGTALFQGMIPRLEPHDLPGSRASYCINADLSRGSLRPIKDTTLVSDIGAGPLRTIYKLGTTWMQFNGVVHVVKAEIADSDHRIFFTGRNTGQPDQTNATMWATESSVRFGIKSPVDVYPTTSALTVALLGTGSGEILQTISYVYTYVDSFGEESAPSAPTANVDVQAGNYVRLQNFKVPSQATCGSIISSIRVYRLEDDGSGSAQYMLIGARPVNLSAAETYTFAGSLIASTSTSVYDANSPTAPTALTSAVGESLPSETWAFLPDNTANLIQWQNGILAATKGNEIYVSEPLIHYAWPLANRNLTQDNVVGLGVFRETLVIPTTSYPYALTGADPQAMSLERLPYKQACLSNRGILSTDWGVIYPSPDGLYMIDSTSGKLVTENLITKEQWQADYHPSELLSFFYDTNIYGWRTGYAYGFLFNLETGDNFRLLDIGVTKGVWHQFYDAATDILYLLIYNTVTSTYQIVSAFTSSTYRPYTWTSKTYRFSEPVSMSVARVFGSFSAGVGFAVYGDGTLRHSSTVLTDRPFRISGGFKAKEWKVTISGVDTVTAFQVASSTLELARTPLNADPSSSGSSGP